MRYDMMNAQLIVRFDPTWLLNPYMSGGDFTGSLGSGESQGGVQVMVHTDRVVFIKAYRPNQKNYMNPNFNNISPAREPILGGFYQVIQCLNTLEGGRMTQQLNMYKYPHMNYYNVAPGQPSNAGVQSGSSSASAGSSSAPAGVSGGDPNAGVPLGATT